MKFLKTTIKFTRFILAGFFVHIMFTANANAIPTQLNEGDFATAISGLSVLTETFDTTPGSSQSSPFEILNGSFSASSTIVIFDGAFSDTFCGQSGDVCIGAANIGGDRTFSALPAGTTFWGSDVFFLGADDEFTISVVGGSGTLNVNAVSPGSLNGFFGFNDPLGITSVTFAHSGNGSNYTFDNIVTASPAEALPAPSAIAILGFGLLALGAAAKRRRKAA